MALRAGVWQKDGRGMFVLVKVAGDDRSLGDGEAAGVDW